MAQPSWITHHVLKGQYGFSGLSYIWEMLPYKRTMETLPCVPKGG